MCLDARTGKRIWHYQLVHHDIWDWDIDGRADAGRHHREREEDQSRRAVTKQAFTFVFDRVTGKPVWPIEERAGAAVRCAGREDLADPAVPHQAAARSTGRGYATTI